MSFFSVYKAIFMHNTNLSYLGICQMLRFHSTSLDRSFADKTNIMRQNSHISDNFTLF